MSKHLPLKGTHMIPLILGTYVLLSTWRMRRCVWTHQPSFVVPLRKGAFIRDTPPKSNIDTKNDGLENASPFKHGYFGYLC